MKTKVLTPPENERPVRTAPNTVTADGSFEEDWKNGISGEEVVKRVQEKIKEWWRENRGNRKV